MAAELVAACGPELLDVLQRRGAAGGVGAFGQPREDHVAQLTTGDALTYGPC